MTVPLEERFWPKVNKNGPVPKHCPELGKCWIWTAARYPAGYGLFVPKKGESPEGAHRIAYRLTVGEIPEGIQVCHRCDNRPCVRPDHLFLGTAKDNAEDRQAKGRWRGGQHNQAGERNPNSIISDANVVLMLAEIAAGEGPVNVARKYGISYKTLWQIRRRKTSVH